MHPQSKKNTVQVAFRVTPELAEQLGEAAEANNRTRSMQVLHYVKLGLAAESSEQEDGKSP